MVVGVGEDLLAAAPGSRRRDRRERREACSFRRHAERTEAADAGAQPARQRAAREAIATRDLPSVTDDGHSVRVLANVSGAAELAVALEAGAEGVGLLRTELAFLAAPEWPTEDEHRRA